MRNRGGSGLPRALILLAVGGVLAGSLLGCADIASGGLASTPSASSTPVVTPTPTPTAPTASQVPAAPAAEPVTIAPPVPPQADLSGATSEALAAASEAHIVALVSGDAATAATFVSSQCFMLAAAYPSLAAVFLQTFPAGIPAPELTITSLAPPDAVVDVAMIDGTVESQTWLYEAGAWKFTGRVDSLCG